MYNNTENTYYYSIYYDNSVKKYNHSTLISDGHIVPNDVILNRIDMQEDETVLLSYNKLNDPEYGFHRVYTINFHNCTDQKEIDLYLRD